MKKLLFISLLSLSILGLQNLEIMASEVTEEDKADKAEETQAIAAEKAAAGVKERTLGERISNLTSPIVACECSHGNRVTHDCSKLCTGVLRGGWKGKAIELTNKGFTCVCERKNYSVPCSSSIYPKACGKLGKPWTGKVSWNSSKGGRSFDSKTQKTEETNCPLPLK